MVPLRRFSLKITRAKQGKPFPPDLVFTAVTTSPIVRHFQMKQYSEAVNLNINHVFEAYSEVEEVILQYQFPQPIVAGRMQDPLTQFAQLKSAIQRQKNKDKKLLVMGISHQGAP